MTVLAELGWDSITANEVFTGQTGTGDTLASGVTLTKDSTSTDPWIIAGQGTDPDTGSTSTAAFRAAYNTGKSSFEIGGTGSYDRFSIRFNMRMTANNGTVVTRFLNGWGSGGEAFRLQVAGTNDLWLYGTTNVKLVTDMSNGGELGTGYFRVELKSDTSSGSITVSIWKDHMGTGAADYSGTVTMWNSNTELTELNVGHCTTANLQPLCYFDNFLMTDTYEDLGPTPYSSGGDVNLTGSLAGSATVAGTPQVERALSGSIAGSTTNVQGTFAATGEVLLTGAVDSSSSVTGTFTVERAFTGAVDGVTTVSGAFSTGTLVEDLGYADDWASDPDQRLDDPSGRRKLDIHYPEGTAPAGGWPTVVWMHGGKWNQGNKTNVLDSTTNGAPRAMLDELLSRGIAVVSGGYRLSADPPNGPGANVHQWPDHIDDVQLMMSYLHDQAATRNLNMELCVLAGHSAGGYLALMHALVASMADPSSQTYWDHSAGGQGASSSVDMRASQRYTGGAFTVALHGVLGVGMWEAPTDLHWNTFREGSLSAFWTADNSIRGLLGDDDYLGDSASRIPAARCDDASPAFDDGAVNQWVESTAPPAWYAACATVSWSNTPVATLNDGSNFTGGNGAAIEDAYDGVGVPFDAHVVSGADHDDINGYESVAFADWVEHLLALQFTGSVSSTTTVSGTFSVEGSVTLSGSVSGSTGVAGGPTVDRELTGAVGGSTAVSGTFAKQGEIPLSGAVSGATTVAGVFTVERPLSGVLGGSTAVSGAFGVERPLTGAVGGSTTVTGTPVADGSTPLSGTIDGSSSVTGTFSTTGPVQLTGAVDGSTTVAGAVELDRVLSGSVASATTIVSTLLVVGPLVRAHRSSDRVRRPDLTRSGSRRTTTED